MDEEPKSKSLAQTQVKENEWYATTGEVSRTYVFPNSGEYTINNPEKVLVKRKPEGDSHRVISYEDGSPVSHYVASGWIAIRWHGEDKTEVFGW